ncbi:MAG: zinc-dependent dehydrogenase, partial [Candidatus Bathyarchaeia archaeon]
MKAAMLYGPYDVRMDEVPVPKISSREILVRMRACGVCGTDVEKMHGKFITPPRLGHEVTGEVAEVGDEVKDVQVGDRIFVHHHVPCYKCHYCRHGDYTMCKEFPETNLDPCGFAEYFRVPEANVVRGAVLKLPSGIDFEKGTLIEPIACCIRGLNKSGLSVGDDVLIIGAGPIGLTMVALLRFYGAHTIIVSEVLDFRLRAAEEFGADYIVNPVGEDLRGKVSEATDGRGADLVIVAVGGSKAIAQGLDCVRKGGLLLLFGAPPRGEILSYDVSRIFINEIKIVPSYSTTEIETSMAAKLLDKHLKNIERLITHRLPLVETPQAIELASKGKDVLKV